MDKKLLSKIKEIYCFLRDKKNKEYDRVLPLNELLTDRKEKAEFLGFGKNTTIYDSSIVLGNVKVGKNTWIGPFTVLDGTGNLKIGDNCSISSGVQIYSHDTVKWALSSGKEKYEKAKTIIGNDCYIGSNSVINKGIKIGNKCVIGAKSFVNKDLPNQSIAVGSPIKIIGKVKINKGKIELVYYKKKHSKK